MWGARALGGRRCAGALVRFSGGGGNQGSIAAVTLEDAKKRELARWSSGEGELPEALAAPIWGRYALFRGHPRISGLLMWDAPASQVVVAGERGGQQFEELLAAPRQPSIAHRTRWPSPARHAARSAPQAGRGTRQPARRSLTLVRALRLARAGKRPPSLPAAQPRRDLRMVRRADTHWPASGGTILLQAVPAGVLPARPQGPPQLPEDLEPT